MPARRSILPALAVVAVTATALVAVPDGSTAAVPRAAAAPVPKSLLIGIDGAMLDRIVAADAPNLDRLIASGTSSQTYRYGTAPSGLTQEAATVSGPGWSTVLTGVWPDKHGVRDNSFTGKQLATWPDYLTRAERLAPGLDTFAVADWDPIATDTAGGPIITGAIDERVGYKSDTDTTGYVVNDEKSTALAVDRLAHGDPDLSFVYLGKTDAAGHASGSASQAYLRSLEADDAQIGRLLAAIQSRPTYAQESWQVVVVNDHGHTPTGGHGGNTLAEREQFVIASGGGIPAGPRRDDLDVTDVVPTIYRHLGLTVPAGLDGTAISQVVPDAFDSVRGSLGTAGWTATPPSGWSVDNSRLPSGGEPAFRGWTFMRNPTWSSFQASQGRENFVRGRGVLAVADSDEWDDVSHGSGPFDSTLTTPSYDVTGRSSVTLGFQTFYQQEGSQRAEVTVRFDGGTPRTLATYTAHTTGRQSYAVTVPAGARTMKVSFRYTGTNNWYWALDDVRVDRGAGARTGRGVIGADDVVTRAFARRGWTWGGLWSDPDFQHFTAGSP